MPEQWNHKIFRVNPDNFEQIALEVFRFQAENNPLYRAYIDILKIKPALIRSLDKIPFLPVRFFKSHEIKTTDFAPAAVFESSGTTASAPGRHFVKDILLYEQSFLQSFELFYGDINNWCIIGLLPSYLERAHSSLVYMTEKLINLSGHPHSGYYLHEFEKLSLVLTELERRMQKTLLIGVTFALLDFAEKFPMPLHYTTVMETGGMKGRRKEMIRNDVHDFLKKAFGIKTVHSEYGMTELLSQAYSAGEGIFNCPRWMKILIRDEEDPFLVKEKGAGTINVIDLANVYSCSFIATDDAGRLYEDGSFEVTGRVDGSDLRGCSLMAV